MAKRKKNRIMSSGASGDGARVEMEEKARSIGRLIGGALPRGVGFGLLLFEFGDSGFLTWLSSGDRSDMAKTMTELLARWKREELQGPTPADIDDVATMLESAVGHDETGGHVGRYQMQIIAAAAISLGASPGLARMIARGAPGTSDEVEREAPCVS